MKQTIASKSPKKKNEMKAMGNMPALNRVQLIGYLGKEPEAASRRMARKWPISAWASHNAGRAAAETKEFTENG